MSEVYKQTCTSPIIILLFIIIIIEKLYTVPSCRGRSVERTPGERDRLVARGSNLSLGDLQRKARSIGGYRYNRPTAKEMPAHNPHQETMNSDSNGTTGL